MSKDFLDKVEEFDENELPDINLKEEEIARLKKEINEIVERIKENHKDMEFKISIEEALEIRNTLGEDYKAKILGIKNAKFIRSLLIENLKRKYGIEKKDIEREYFSKLKGSDLWWWKASICYDFVVTKDKMLIIGFDADYNINIEKYIGIDEINKVGMIRERNEWAMVCGRDAQIILKDKTFIYIDNWKEDREEDLREFIDYLKSKGIKTFTRSKAKKYNITLIIVYIATIITLIYLFWEFIFKI